MMPGLPLDLCGIIFGAQAPGDETDDSSTPQFRGDSSIGDKINGHPSNEEKDGKEEQFSPKIERGPPMKHEDRYIPPFYPVMQKKRGDVSVSPLAMTIYRTANQAMISLTRPAPTVRPPSRIAKRMVFSRAMGVMSSTSIWMLSPGITISTPSGSLMLPVTSVVRT